ncbi:phage holin family protein [Leptolyngbya sp. FACHB-261]|uniref:phage holin family protein n=1 Tax=Leptolyngbya sp. FACHB-261 TaxID=2692806 RepID=UPI001688DA49|nr:phage holin family protein [Leptolyngbya sp. FACHB-261]MBD2099515.1 phage holin family protein [Leptolyngbya sp. FACHB-261]
MQPIYWISSSLLSALTLGGMSWILPGIRISRGMDLLLAMVVAGIANGLASVLLSAMEPRPSLWLCAALWLLGNTLLCWLTFGWLKGLSASRVGSALLNPLALTGMNVLLGGALGLY